MLDAAGAAWIVQFEILRPGAFQPPPTFQPGSNDVVIQLNSEDGMDSDDSLNNPLSALAASRATDGAAMEADGALA